MNKEDQMLSALLADKQRLCEKRGIPTFSGFLSPAEVNFAEGFCIAQKARFVLDGGYEDAERRICVFLPEFDYYDYPEDRQVRSPNMIEGDRSSNLEADDSRSSFLVTEGGWSSDSSAENGRSGSLLIKDGRPNNLMTGNDRPEGLWSENDPLAVLRIVSAKHGRELTHRDYLGAVLGLGVQRSVVGDIIVIENGADIVILKEMAEFFELNLTAVGRAEVSVSVCGRDILAAAEQKTERLRDTVASLRLDSICASAFRLARGRAQEAIRQGLVSVNGRQCLKPDAEVAETDRISFRGKGKAILSEVGGRTRKDRIAIIIDRLK